MVANGGRPMSRLTPVKGSAARSQLVYPATRPARRRAMKLDISNHLFPKAYFDRMVALSPQGKDITKRGRGVPSIVDLDERFRIMDKFDDYAQVICLPAPAIEDFGKNAAEMAKLGNDGMAEGGRKHPGRFPALLAGLP